ncbi:TPA: hypothetical protein N0F65_003969 [Lagenidium giganteum]|uniref:Uncharacterized protein n=1 Tax=Lagenidium giganteum TaxID=4803 RepID=A0AAV2YTP4_9STRA|nr:TPA: hypothetical protein N0F65_003969 [Lagenidium giganteum]
MSMTHREAEADEIVLHDLIVQRATQQQYFHRLQTEIKHGPGKLPKKDKNRKGKGGGDRDRKPVPPTAKKPAPRNGCWICKQEQWLKVCPNATAEEKAAPIRQMEEKKKSLTTRSHK